MEQKIKDNPVEPCYKCSECKSWKACAVSGDWFSPSEIRYCPTQTRWILEHLALMESGRWPMEYTTKLPAEPSNCQPPGNAPFEVTKTVTGEISKRFEKCANTKDGILAYQVLVMGWDEGILAELMNTDIRKLERRIRRVVSYCSGWKRRTVSYDEYCRFKSPSRITEMAKM